MSTPQHPLTETAATQMWSTASRIVWIGLPDIYRSGTVAALRAAFDAGREHERDHAAQAHPADVTTEAIRREVEYAVRTAAAHGYAKGKWGEDRSEPIQALIKSASAALTAALATTPTEPLARTLLAVPDGHGAPHHDAGQIEPGDYVLQVDEDGTTRGGRAHHQDEDGDWWTETDVCIVWAARRADRPDALTVWPAPTPPAEEVELPTEHPAQLLDVKIASGDGYAFMALDRRGHWVGVNQDGDVREWTPGWVIAFTLPDGTRARRDGEHANGEPRFVKESA